MEDTDKFLLKIARKAIEEFVKNKRIITCDDCPEELKVKKGVFVTIYKGKEKSLRGCIGIPYPEGTLIENVIKAAISSTLDPRFKPLGEDELDDISLEISILSEPKLIKVKNPKEYLEKIEKGKDGLIIEDGINSGIFLPQVWKEIPDKKEFLANLCLKAGMMPDSWLSKNINLYKFEAKIISED
jgi:uncharacterized protein